MEILIALLLVIIIVMLAMLMKTVGIIATKLEETGKTSDTNKAPVQSEGARPGETSSRPPDELPQ